MGVKAEACHEKASFLGSGSIIDLLQESSEMNCYCPNLVAEILPGVRALKIPGTVSCGQAPFGCVALAREFRVRRTLGGTPFQTGV